MQRSTKRPALRSRATLKPETYPAPPAGDFTPGKRGRIQKRPLVPRRGGRMFQRGEVERLHGNARDAGASATLPGLETRARQLHRQTSIHACSEASLEFVKLAGLQTDEDTNTMTLNLMDYFLFSEANWLPELSYCKLHAACFLFACRMTGKDNTIDQVADSLGLDSAFVQLTSSPLAGHEESAVAIQCAISVTASDVEDGYALLYERKERLGAVMGDYADKLDNLPIPKLLSRSDEEYVRQYENENLDVFEVDE